MDTVVDILDVGERQKVVQPIGGAGPRKLNLAGFDAMDNAHVQAIVAHDFHVLFDLVGRNHSGLSVLAVEKNAPAPAWFRSFQYGTASASLRGVRCAKIERTDGDQRGADRERRVRTAMSLRKSVGIGTGGDDRELLRVIYP
jgi:hypothetical protein